MVRKCFYCFTCVFIILCLNLPCLGGSWFPGTDFPPPIPRPQPRGNAETDPIFKGSPAAKITQGDVENLQNGGLGGTHRLSEIPPENPISGDQFIGPSGRVCTYMEFPLWGTAPGEWRSMGYKGDDRLCRTPIGTPPTLKAATAEDKELSSGYLTWSHTVSVEDNDPAGIMFAEVILSSSAGDIYIGDGTLFRSPNYGDTFDAEIELVVYKVASDQFVLYPGGQTFWTDDITAYLRFLYLPPGQYSISVILTDRDGNRVKGNSSAVLTLQ